MSKIDTVWLLAGSYQEGRGFLPAIKLALYLGESKDLVPALGVSSCSWAAKTVPGDVLRCLGKCARWFPQVVPRGSIADRDGSA